MTQVRVAALSLNQIPLDWDGNLENILTAIAEARRIGATLVCLPELCITGYGCEDAFLWPATSRMALECLGDIVRQTNGLIVSVGLPLVVGDVLYNGAALIVDGTLVGVALKQYLAGDGIHYEPRWFAPWRKNQRADVVVGGCSIPVGDLIFDVGGVRIGFEICEDAWVKDRPGRRLARAGVNVILGPSASHFSFKKHAIRRKLVLEGVAEFQASYIYCNLLGNEAGRAIYDGDSVIAHPTPEGPEIRAEARRLSFRRYTITCVNLDWGVMGGVQTDSNEKCKRASEDPCGQESPRLVSCPFSFPEVVRRELVSEHTPGANDRGELSKDDALARVIALGLFDYLRKSHAKGFVVSLSGGADSAAVATLVWQMVMLGAAELGLEEFQARLGIELAQRAHDVPALMRRLLTTVYQSTRNSSEVTRKAAFEVALALGAEHHEIDIDPLVQTYKCLVEQVEQRELNWGRDDLALQNIQARVRAPTVWMMANLRGALLLSTSNRSEAAVGYATMDGDTAGGLCPIGGVDKAYLRRWLIFMEEEGVGQSGPIAALRVINQQEPTAELRPLESAQTDEKDLMPYEVLDAIERRAVVERISPAQVLSEMRVEFTQYSAEQHLVWVRRFYHLFAVNQWKRERYAPCFHVDDVNLDPKTWCRFPILSGAFARELAELKI